MYKPQEISQATMQWIMRQALNELNAFLCEVNPNEQYGKVWPRDARAIAEGCREVAAAATEPNEKSEWFEIADQYEDTIQSEVVPTDCVR